VRPTGANAASGLSFLEPDWVTFPNAIPTNRGVTIVQGRKVTPAMAAGIADRVWTRQEIAALLH
jgi:hypothetical protein